MLFSLDTNVASIDKARSFNIFLRSSPYLGAFTAATFSVPLTVFIISAASACPSTSLATIINGRVSRATISSTGISSSTESIFSSVTNTKGSSYFTTPLFSSVIKAAAKYPESKRNPSSTSRLVSMARASSIVIEPSLPAKSTARPISFPIVVSPLEEMVAMCVTSSSELMGVATLFKLFVTASTALSMPRLSSIGAAPAARCF